MSHLVTEVTNRTSAGTALGDKAATATATQGPERQLRTGIFTAARTLTG
jgi:hypothetical protein